jgi:glycosyl hydrolase family 42 (putative beta-galactosidase)
MSPRLLSLFIFLTLGIAPESQGAEQELTPIIRFANPADAARISATNARLSQVTGTRVNAGGAAARVEFESADWPQLVIRPGEGPADWSGVSALAIPIDNPTGEMADLVVRVDDDPRADGEHHSLSGRARVRPGEAGVLILPLPTNEALPMGMVAGPPREAPRLGAPVRVMDGARGAVDRRHVTAIRLILLSRSSGRSLIFGDPGIIRGADPGPEAYQSIVDGFGQYTRAHWDGKIESAEDLQRARLGEEQELRERLPPAIKLDRYGGLLEGRVFDATGFFHTERREGRWWLVTPDGHGFFSLGIDVVSPDVGATFVEGREAMFAKLPDSGSALIAHYGYADERGRLPKERGRQFDRGRSFDFYAANLHRKYGPDYLPLWRRTAVDRLRAWGFNTIGNWSEPELLKRREMAYVVPIHISGNFASVGSGWAKMPDPFDPAFAATVDGDVLKAASAYRDDSWLIGYFVDNELAWGLGNATDPQLRYGLAIETLRLGSASPAKRAFVAQLREKYGEIENLAAQWGITVNSWAELVEENLTPPASSPAVIQDLQAFSRFFAEAYFRIVAAAIRRHDPQHLYLGSRFQARSPEAVEACAKYCDVVSFNVYREELGGEEWRQFHALGKPAIIGEFQFGSTDTGLFWPGLFDVAAADQRGPAYAAYLRSAMDNPDIVGCHWFQYVDEPLTGRLLDGENGNMGFVAVTDRPYGSLVSAAREANLALLKSLQH